MLNRQAVKNVTIPLVPGEMKATVIDASMLQVARRGESESGRCGTGTRSRGEPLLLACWERRVPRISLGPRNTADIRNPVRYLVHGLERRAEVPRHDRAGLRRAGEAASGLCSCHLLLCPCPVKLCPATCHHCRCPVPPSEPRRRSLQAPAGGRIITIVRWPNNGPGWQLRRTVASAS